MNFWCWMSGFDWGRRTQILRSRSPSTDAQRGGAQPGGQTVTYLRALPQRAATCLHGAHPRLLPSEPCRSGRGRCRCRQNTASGAHMSDPLILTLRLLVWFIFFKKKNHTQHNFLCLREGRKVKKYHYKGSKDFRDIKLLWQTIFMS